MYSNVLQNEITFSKLNQTAWILFKSVEALVD